MARQPQDSYAALAGLPTRTDATFPPWAEPTCGEPRPSDCCPVAAHLHALTHGQPTQTMDSDRNVTQARSAPSAENHDSAEHQITDETKRSEQSDFEHTDSFDGASNPTSAPKRRLPSLRPCSIQMQPHPELSVQQTTTWCAALVAAHSARHTDGTAPNAITPRSGLYNIGNSERRTCQTGCPPMAFDRTPCLSSFRRA